MIEKVIDGICFALSSKFGEEREIYTESVKQGLEDGSFSIELNNPFGDLYSRKAIFNSARRKNIDLYLDYFTIPSKVKL